MSNFFAHLGTITKHRHMVIVHCFKAAIPLRGLLHDLSKYSPTEFFPGVKYYQGKRSPNEGERDAYGYSKAWMHHKGRNKHHFEYWTDYSKAQGRDIAVKMPLKYVIEMFCDRVAAGKIYGRENYNQSCPLDYFLKGAKFRLIHPETSALLESLLVMLARQGEKETFYYIRHTLRKQKTY